MDSYMPSSEASSLMTGLFCDPGELVSVAPDYSAVASCNSGVVCRGAWNSMVLARAVLPATAGANNQATSDDLSGLNTWDFAMMRSEFGDLQNIDSAALISLYRPEGAAPNPLNSTARMAGVGDDSMTDLDAAERETPRSRSDSGYSTSTLSGAYATRTTGLHVATWDPCCGRGGWDCGSPVLSSCGSGFGGDNNSSSCCSSSCHGGWSPPHQNRANATSTTPAVSGSRAAGKSRRSNSQRSRTNAAATGAAVSSGAGSEAEVKLARKPRARPAKTRQLQLWQFLYHQVQLQGAWASPEDAPLRWESRLEGTFRIANPTALADAWGAHRRRSNMTYEKMSRTLRYYYDRRLITKVAGKQHTYRFHFDQFPDQ